MTADQFWELLAKKLSNEATEQELIEFEKVQASEPKLKAEAELLTSLWQQPLPLSSPESLLSFEHHLERLKKAGIEIDDIQHGYNTGDQEMPAKSRSHWFRKLFITASTVTAIIILFFIFRPSAERAVVEAVKSSVAKVSTKPGSRSQLQLPDGSSVWLNASSNLTYSKDFGKNLREVNLSGEAFFDVVKDPAHPFIIHTKAVDVKVLGTEFNVKAYPEDPTTETSLIRGSVELTVKNKSRDVYHLKPNEKLVVVNSLVDEAIPVKQVKAQPIFSVGKLNYDHTDSTIVETSWVQNKLIFQQNESFREVAVKMERWYNVHIAFASERVAEYRPFVTFTTETITQALDALKEGLPEFNYKVTGNDILITE